MPPRRLRFFAACDCPISFVLTAVWLLFLSVQSSAQPQQLEPPPLPVDPTPLIELLAPSEKATLDETRTRPKKLLDAYLKIADTHLDAAYKAIQSSEPQSAERDLDIYNKTLAEAAQLTFSQTSDRRSMAKRLEQVLYKQLKTLDLVERLFPDDRIGFAQDAHRKTKQLRVKALNESFGAGDILQDPKAEKPDRKEPPPKSGAVKNPPLSYQPLRADRVRRVAAQIAGDYLTEEEDDQVRKAQKADERMAVFMKIADRRIAALKPIAIDPTDKKAQKKAEEEAREWGVLGKLDRADLLRHYKLALEEAMAKLEDAYERNPKSPAIKVALNSLLEGTDRHLPILRAFESELKSEKELAALKAAIYQAEVANDGARDGLK